MLCALLTKWIEKRLLKDNTSLEAVTLTEENDNEVLKLVNLTMNTHTGNAIYV